MGRSSDPQKETALEALFQVMKNLKIAHRPGPSHDLFFMVKNAIHLWKTAHQPSKSKVHLTGKVCIPICDDYWDKQQLSAPENKKTRDLLLQTISTWFDRRSKKSSKNKVINQKLLEDWMKKIQIETGASKARPTASPRPKVVPHRKRQKSLDYLEREWRKLDKDELIAELSNLKKECKRLKETLAETLTVQLKRKRANSMELPVRCDPGHSSSGNMLDTIIDNNSNNSKKSKNCHHHDHSHCQHQKNRSEEEEKNSEEKKREKHAHGKDCGHRAILHKTSFHAEPHIDFLVNGVLDCKHQDLDCCSNVDCNEYDCNDFELVDEDFDIDLEKLVDLLD